MKLKYIFLSLIAAVGLFSSCSDDNDPTYLNEVRLSSSYVALPQNGGSQSIDITAKDSWTINASTVPEWLTVSPASGGAGQGSINFSVASTDAARDCEVLLECGGRTQRINVMQYAEETEPVMLSVAEAVALIKSGKAPGSAVYVKGIVCRIQEISPKKPDGSGYGNATYFISDDGTFGDGNWLQIYRGKWYNGADYAPGDEFSVGDEMVIKGVLIDYNGTPETQERTAEVVSITKSLIKVDSTYVAGVASNELPVEGGDLTAYLTCLGNGIQVEIPEDAKEWLFINAINTGGIPTVTFHALANAGGDRSTTVTFKTTDGKKDYASEVTLIQKGAIVKATVAEFLAAEENSTNYRIQGVITSMYASDKQGKSFTIADHTGSVLVYRAEGFLESGAKVGDVVTVVGVRTSFRETPQMGTPTFESLDYAVETVSIADFRNLPDNKEAYYLISGTIEHVTESSLGAKDDVTQYGNFNLTDNTGSVYVYGVLKGWGGPKGQFGDLNLTWGDKLTIIAYKTTYKGLVEGVGVYLSSEKQ